MRKFRLIAAAAAVLASAFAFGTASPASAGTRVCVGQGTITLTNVVNSAGTYGLFLSAFGPPSTADIRLDSTIQCLLGPVNPFPSSLSVSGGLVNAHCGRSSGNPANPVTLQEGTHRHTFEIFETLGTVLIGVDTDGVGVVLGNAVADPLHANHGTHTNGNSCITGYAHSFIATGLGVTVL